MSAHAATEAAFAAALLDPSRPLPDGLRSSRGDVDPARFAVYRNNVFVGLVEALARRFPVVARLVGDEFFRAMARVYAAASPPSSPVMARYGDDFPDHVAAFPPAAHLPYLADVARLEALVTVAYHAADRLPLTVPDLAAIDPEDLLARRLAPHPAAGLVRSDHPIGWIWSVHQEAEVRPLEHWNAETVLVTRPDDAVTLAVLPPADSRFAADLLAGAPIGEAAAAALDAAPGFDLGRALVGLVSRGAFADLESALVFPSAAAGAHR